MIKSIQYFAEADTTWILAAFRNVSRREMMFSLGQHDPELTTVFSRWYTGPTTYRMHYDVIRANSGIDQGCPLSPCGFAGAEEDAASFDNEIVLYWSQLACRHVTSRLFHLPLRMGGLGVGSAAQRRAAAPWTAWQTVIPTPTDSLDTDSLLAATPTLRGQLLHLRSALAHHMNTPP